MTATQQVAGQVKSQCGQQMLRCIDAEVANFLQSQSLQACKLHLVFRLAQGLGFHGQALSQQA